MTIVHECHTIKVLGHEKNVLFVLPILKLHKLHLVFVLFLFLAPGFVGYLLLLNQLFF